MKSSWLFAAALAVGTGARAQECRPDVRQLTVYTLEGKTLVPNEVRARAKDMATKVLAGAGVTVEWVKGERPRDPQQTYCGERLTIVFDAKAGAGFAAQAMAYTTLNAGWSTEIHIFYDRVSAFPDRTRMAEFLGHVLAHEIAHVLQGSVRHSNEGVMKARWSDRDCAELVRKPLPFTAEDVELIRSRFNTRTTLAGQELR
jgi:hypothetical protein